VDAWSGLDAAIQRRHAGFSVRLGPVNTNEHI
jgi:hypothetical protein